MVSQLLVASSLELKPLASKILAPIVDKFVDGDFFAPRLYIADRPHVQAHNAVIGFLGAHRKHRMGTFLSVLSLRYVILDTRLFMSC